LIKLGSKGTKEIIKYNIKIEQCQFEKAQHICAESAGRKVYAFFVTSKTLALPNQNQTFHSTRCITPKRVASWRCLSLRSKIGRKVFFILSDVIVTPSLPKS